jgi:hypothetical protein
MKKIIIKSLIITIIVLVIATIGGSFFMLHISLDPYANRRDTASRLQREFDRYPETIQWFDSIKSVGAFRDTFATLSTGDRLHAYYINNNSKKTAMVLHGWHDCALDYLYLARIYDHILGYNVLMPEFYAHGFSDGSKVRMGWLDRFDMLGWMEMFKTDTMVVHGVSMGGATTMMISGEKIPDGIIDIRFVEDCGYTDVWDEFEYELKKEFGLPAFPLMYTTDWLCRWRYGWGFKEASAINQVKKCKYPMLMIHGGNDKFVPTEMVYRVYDAKPMPKQLWVADSSAHVFSYKDHRDEYIKKIVDFCSE